MGVGILVHGIVFIRHHAAHPGVGELQSFGHLALGVQRDTGAVQAFPSAFQRTGSGAVGIDAQIDNSLGGFGLVIVIPADPVDQTLGLAQHIAAAAAKTRDKVQGVLCGADLAQTQTGRVALTNPKGKNAIFLILIQRHIGFTPYLTKITILIIS